MEGWPAINNTDRCSKLPTSIVIRGGALIIDGRKRTPSDACELLDSRCHEVEGDQGKEGFVEERWRGESAM